MYLQRLFETRGGDSWGRAPTAAQSRNLRNRYGKFIEIIIQALIDDGSNVICSNKLTDEFIRQVVCIEKFFLEPVLVVALDSEYDSQTKNPSRVFWDSLSGVDTIIIN